ncbi:MAG: pyrroline-5-carboxylate reductase [Clostridia bacterium]|nr:pyrroline-5-carboxylate reductase [Clostridia bacterium]
MSRLGMIGVGNMGGAILRGMLNAHYIKPSQLCVYDANLDKLEVMSREIPDITYLDNALDLVRECDMILFAVKPYVLGPLLEQVSSALSGKAVISIAAGWTTHMLEEAIAPHGGTYLRVMPNTPAMVGEGMTALCEEYTFSEEDFAFAKGIFEALGRTVTLPERLFDGVIAISGSSPAYVYMMIEAMAQSGVSYGIPMDTALEMAAQSVLGSAVMVLSSGEHPSVLRDAVCSPAGTTIEAVKVLEQSGFKAAVMNAMDACAEKSRSMAK